MPTPTRLEKTIKREFIPLEYMEVEEQFCYTPPTPGGPSPTPGGGSNCTVVITRSVTITGSGSVTPLPGEFLFNLTHSEGGVTYVFATLVCTP